VAENLTRRDLTRRDLLKGGLAVAGAGMLSAIPLAVDAATATRVVVLVDDYMPQAIRGTAEWYYSRLDADRGRINAPGAGTVDMGHGTATARITTATNTFVGMYHALQHTQREGLPLDLGAILPPQILPAFQGRVVGVRVSVADGAGLFQVELQPWAARAALTGGPQVIEFAVPPLGRVQSLNWILLGNPGDFVTVTRVELIVEAPAQPVASRAFLWSFAMLLANWDTASGLVRDRAGFPSGAFDAASVSGHLAATAVSAWQLGFITRASAADITLRTTRGLLALPRMKGLLPHFVTSGSLTPGTEYSSVDTALTVVPLLCAREALGLDRALTNQLEHLLMDIDWNALTFPDGTIGHGFDESGARLPYSWVDFGGETWAVNLACAAATGRVAPMRPPPTFNGSAFITALPWSFLPRPRVDAYGVHWAQEEARAAREQVRYYRERAHEQPCYDERRLFGLSAAEVPEPSAVAPAQIYQPFGTGGTVPASDGAALLGGPVVVPHASAVVAAERPWAALGCWQSLMDQGLFTPLNNCESLMAAPSAQGTAQGTDVCGPVVFNSLRGSWNLALQAAGWARYLTGRENLVRRGALRNPLLRRGYRTLRGE
jgi:hypothetical protein